MKRGVLVASLGLLALAASCLPALPAGAAAPKVTITSRGVERVDTYTDRETDDYYATFVVRDTSHRGKQVSQCLVANNDDRYDCDTYNLRDSKFRDGTWRVRQTQSGWEIRYYVGYYESTRAECLRETPGKFLQGVDIAILGNYENVLAQRTHRWELVCQGFIAASSGEHYITARVARASAPLSIGVALIDGRHVIASARACLYNSKTGRGEACTTRALSQVAKRTPRGWTYSTQVRAQGVTASQCSTMRKKPGRYDYRVVFTDRKGKRIATLSHFVYVTCR